MWRLRAPLLCVLDSNRCLACVHTFPKTANVITADRGTKKTPSESFKSSTSTIEAENSPSTSSSQSLTVTPNARTLRALARKYNFPRLITAFQVYFNEERHRRYAEDEDDVSRLSIYRSWRQRPDEEQQIYRDSAERIRRNKLVVWQMDMQSKGLDKVAQLLIDNKKTIVGKSDQNKWRRRMVEV